MMLPPISRHNQMQPPPPITMTPPEPESITILRIKRKRTDEPLDALVVETPNAKKKRGSGATGVFTFAETIDENEFLNDESSTEALHKRIAALSRANDLASSPSPTRSAKGSASRVIASLPRSARSYSIVDAKGPSLPVTPLLPSRPQSVVPPKNAPISASLLSDVPVQSSPMEPSFRVFEAVPQKPKPDTKSPYQPIEEPDPMDEFTAMVNDYLKLNDIELDPRSGPSHPSSQTMQGSDQDQEDTSDDEDYVYDVFYFRRHNADDLERLVARETAVIGRLSGLPRFEDWDDEDDDSDSGLDEVDEDSNEENYYRNDYPDEEEHSEEEENPWERDGGF